MQRSGRPFLWFLLPILAGVIFVFTVERGWLAPFQPTPSTWGKFSGDPKATFLPDGREMMLLDDFSYTAPSGKVWLAKANLKIDGASIPSEFWSVVGGPFEGKFRNASIVHDSACVLKTETWQDVHYMFYEACRCGGVNESAAKLLYTAVYQFGPKWNFVEEVKMVTLPDGTKKAETVKVAVPVRMAVMPPPPSEVEKLKAYIIKNNPTIEQLQKLDLEKLD